ncbi:MAG: hypothetical protein MK105_14115 [Crocinitomicaceae bacterium]|nr:hypothetical protein [Crocinitomicaceae bacterium]
MPNLFAKLFFSFAFACVYIFYYGGGDTTAYYDGAVALNNLFLKSPTLYFEQMLSPPNMYKFTQYFDLQTTYPPGWIYREPEGFFVCKLMSLISFLTLKSYLAMTFIMAFVTSIVSWKLFLLVRNYKFSNKKLLAFGVLLLPSVNFWCTGVSKDTVVFIAAITMIVNIFKLISSNYQTGLKNYFFLILSAFVIYHIRSFVLASILLPILFSLGVRLVKSLGGGHNAVVFFRTFFILIGFAIGGRTLLIQSEGDFLKSNSFLQQAAIIQDDFQNNDSYGTKRYSLGDVEFTPLGLIKTSPLAIITGVYRPFIWEARSITLLINGLESIIFIFFTFIFFKAGIKAKWRKIRSHEFLIFCFLFVFIIAFMTGLTSGLYGVLVRLRAPLLPFLFILLTIEWNSLTPTQEKRLIS